VCAYVYVYVYVFMCMCVYVCLCVVLCLPAGHNAIGILYVSQSIALHLCTVTLSLNPASGWKSEVVDRREGVVQGEAPAVFRALPKRALLASKHDLDTLSSMSYIVRPVLSLPTTQSPHASSIISRIEGASGQRSKKGMSSKELEI
jgi:hypothetical protein